MKAIIIHHKDKGPTVSVEIDPEDTYSMDHTLSYIIVPMLEQLKATGQTSHDVDKDDVPEYLYKSNGYIVEAFPDSNYEKRWNYVLDEMIWAFSAIRDGLLYKSDTDFNRIENGTRLFGKYFTRLWD